MPATAAEMSLLALAVLFDDHIDRHAHQRPHVGREHAVAARDQDDVVVGADAGHDLLDARIARTRQLFDLLQHPHFGGGVERGDRIAVGIVRRLRARRDFRGNLDLARAMTRDRARRDRRLGQRLERNVIRIRKGGLVADDRAHTDALLNIETAALDDAFLERKRFAARILKVQIGVIGTVLKNCRQHALQLRFVQPERVKQQLLGGGKVGEGGIGDFH